MLIDDLAILRHLASGEGQNLASAANGPALFDAVVGRERATEQTRRQFSRELVSLREAGYLRFSHYPGPGVAPARPDDQHFLDQLFDFALTPEGATADSDVSSRRRTLSRERTTVEPSRS